MEKNRAPLPNLFKIKKIAAMPLTIRYTDTKHSHQATGDAIQSAAIIRIVKSYMLHPSDFDLMHIDLRDESCEQVTCTLGDRDICYFGGAQAWNIYRMTAEIWPDINYHTAGRPAPIPNP